jgi:GDPmannose 4,6-dehydratase
MHAGNGIFFNHESPRRGENFVTRKICRAAAEISVGKRTELRMGDLKASRDWGDARDYVRGMWLMLQQDQPDDYVLATGKLHSVEDVVSIAFQTVKLDWREYVRRDERFDRPQEPCNLVGNSSKAQQRLNWQPQSDFHSLISEMTESEINLIKHQPDSSDI